MGHYSFGLCGVFFRTSKFKNEISYIKYKFSHRFGKVYRWLNMYYLKMKTIILKKVTTMVIWIILKNLVWTCRECNFYQYWATIACIYPKIVISHIIISILAHYVPLKYTRRNLVLNFPPPTHCNYCSIWLHFNYS